MGHRALTDEQAREMADYVMAEAEQIWDAAGCPYDFGVQHAMGDVIIFGGTNRVQWSVKHGFCADRSYCTERFLAAFDRLYPGQAPKDGGRTR